MKRLQKGCFGAVVLLLVVGTGGWMWLQNTMKQVPFGASKESLQHSHFEHSPQFGEEHFVNDPPSKSYGIWDNLTDMFGGQQRIPPGPFPTMKPVFSKEAPKDLQTTWLGHSTVLVEMNGIRWLTDPMFSDFVFPIHAVAPQRINPPPIEMTDLPKVDFVTISHDHYDHLDMNSVLFLSTQGTVFFVGLGVGEHLKHFGVPNEQIHEMDWWDSFEMGGVEIHCTPARHYSGRRSMDHSTLWTSWVVKSTEYSVFHSGDSGYEGHFKEIQTRLGSMDLTMIKVGDYGKDLGWQDIHMIPENSIKAHMDLQGRTLLPIHWGTFVLSNHDWDEPIERTWEAAKENGVDLRTPRFGEVVEYNKSYQSVQWWRHIKSLE